VIVEAKYALRPLSIRPEHFLDHVVEALGFEDINFEWDEFNRAFHVTAADKQYAYDVINQKMIEFLMEHKGLCLEVFGANVIVYTGRVFTCDDFLAALNFAGGFLGLLPDYLEEKLRAQ